MQWASKNKIIKTLKDKAFKDKAVKNKGPKTPKTILFKMG